MDINHSPLSGSKSNTSGASRKTTVTKSVSDTVRTKDTTHTSSLSNIKVTDLKDGQILRGQIIDHRYQEVSIQLQPGNQIVKASLAGDIPLTIGQDAKFQVTGEVNEHLVLKYLPEEAGAPADTTVFKALSASGFAMTDRNKAIVSELLSRRMPVDKQTLMELIRLSNTNREASPLTLVLMHKNNIPMTPSNIKLFESYQNGATKILSDIRTITANLSELLTNTQSINTASQSDPVAALFKEEAIQTNGKLIDILYGNTSSEASVTQGASGNLQASFPDVSQLLEQISNGTTSKEEALKMLTAGLPESDQQKFLQGMSLTSFNPQEEFLSGLDLNKLLEEVTKLQENTVTIAGALDPSERDTFLKLISSLPSGEELKGQITDGTASLQKVLSMLQENLPLADKEIAQALLQAPEYRKLLEEAFHQKWTITPEKLAKKAPVSDLYRNLQEDIEKLDHLVKKSETSEEYMQIREPVKNLQENLRFMKDLNEMFTYLQLPVQTKEQDIHSELYVFSRKEALRNKKDNLSVLLHLDMTNLGSLNIHIQKYNSLISAKFYMEDTPSRQLIMQNIPLLEDALKKKGYDLHAEMEANYVKPDFIHDFIEQNSQDNTIKNYTFDIRT